MHGIIDDGCHGMYSYLGVNILHINQLVDLLVQADSLLGHVQNMADVSRNINYLSCDLIQFCLALYIWQDIERRIFQTQQILVYVDRLLL